MSSSNNQPRDNVLGETDDSPPVMEVASSVVEPIIITDTQARWVLENKGILSRDSCIQLQLLVPDAQDKLGFLPVGSGIYSLIKTAVLRIGARRINTIQDLAFLKTMTHAYDTPSYRTNVTRILKGINTSMIPANVEPAGLIGGMFVPAGGDLNAEGEQIQDSQMRLRSTPELTPSWSIKLSELFPILNDIELPLFLLKDEVAIDLTFRTQSATDGPNGTGSICCFEPKVGPPTMVLATCKLDKPNVLLFLDTIYYSNERMEQEAERVNAKNGLYLNYTDVIQNVANLPALPAINIGTETEMSTQQKVSQVPLSGFRVKNLFWCYNAGDRQPVTTNPVTATTDYRYYNPLLGKYSMMGYKKDDTWDLRVNDVLQFPQPVTSATLKASEAEDVYGSPVWLNHALYSHNPTSVKAGLYPTLATNALLPNPTQYKCWDGLPVDELNGNLAFSAVNLSSGWGNDNDDFVLINQKPIEVLHSDLPVNAKTNVTRNAYYYAECVKTFAILDGQAQVFQQPAVPVGR